MTIGLFPLWCFPMKSIAFPLISSRSLGGGEVWKKCSHDLRMFSADDSNGGGGGDDDGEESI